MRSLPRVLLAHLPTPIEFLPRLSAEFKGPQIYVKRDDQTGLALGGNKTRKLEYLVAEAISKNARTLITAGAAQSNHCRQTAAAAARSGMDCILVLSGDSPVKATGNLLLDSLFNANIIWSRPHERDQKLSETYEMAARNGQEPYLVPYGGSNPTGASAYVMATKEMLDQGFQPDWIVFASSSGGTQAGLALGARLFDYKGKVLGISVDEPHEILTKRVAALATSTARFLEEQISFTPEEVIVNADYTGKGYGIMGKAEREAITYFARLEGLLLDPVYTGRAAAGLIDLIRQGHFKPDNKILFWHTGGSPALFAEKYQMIVDSSD